MTLQKIENAVAELTKAFTESIAKLTEKVNAIETHINESQPDADMKEQNDQLAAALNKAKESTETLKKQLGEKDTKIAELEKGLTDTKEALEKEKTAHEELKKNPTAQGARAAEMIISQAAGTPLATSEGGTGSPTNGNGELKGAARAAAAFESQPTIQKWSERNRKR